MILNMWYEAREGEVSTGVVSRKYETTEMVMILHVNVILYQEEIHYRIP